MGSKIFLSYEESSPEFVKKVKDLARELETQGFEIIADFNSLYPGQEINSFIQRLILDPTIDHVLILLNPAYAQKADARSKGVGKETELISYDVLGDPTQTKFIPVVLEKDGDPLSSIPAFLRPRYFIDLSDESSFSQHFEELINALKRSASSKSRAETSSSSNQLILVPYSRKGLSYELLEKERLRSDIQNVITHPGSAFSIVVKDKNNSIETSLSRCSFGIDCFLRLITNDSFFLGVWKDYCYDRMKKIKADALEKKRLKVFLKKNGSETAIYFYEVKYAVRLISRILNFGRKIDFNNSVSLDGISAGNKISFPFWIETKKLRDFCETSRDIDFEALTTIPVYGYRVIELSNEIICEDAAPAFFNRIGDYKDLIQKESDLLDFTSYFLGPH
jgi:hypothetical protein